MLHEAAGGCGVTALLPGRGVERLTWMDLDDRAVGAPEAGDTLGDAKVLAASVRVPGGACAGGEADGGDDHPLVPLVGERDRVEPDVTGELFGRVNDRVDDAYRAKYAGSPYLPPMLTEKVRAATVRVDPR